jgi:RNA polymerase sigma-70 factor (ECF subfamily)
VKYDDNTSLTLLNEAIDRRPDAWKTMVDLYAPLVRYWCRQASIPTQDVADLEQEIFAAVAANLANFLTSPNRFSFRAWMRGITRHKISDYYVTYRERAIGGADAQKQFEQLPDHRVDPELSESPRVLGELYYRALMLMRQRFEERTWSAFWQVAVEGRASADVADDLGVSMETIRQSKSRVLRLLKSELGPLL